MKDNCPCEMCRIEREKEYVCRFSNCNSYLSWLKRMQEKEKGVRNGKRGQGRAGKA